MIAQIVSLQVVPGHRDEFLAAIRTQAETSFTKEPGCVQFDVVCDLEDDHHFTFYEMYVDEAAVEAHRATPHFPVWRAAMEKHVIASSRNVTLSQRIYHHP